LYACTRNFHCLQRSFKIACFKLWD